MGGSSQGQQRPMAKDERNKMLMQTIIERKFGPQIAAKKAADEKAAADKAAADKAAADKAATQTAAEKAAADKAAADKAIADKAAADALVPAQAMKNVTIPQSGAYAPISAVRPTATLVPETKAYSMPQPAEMNKSVAAAAAAAQANKTSTGTNQFSAPVLNGITFGGS